MSFLQHVNELRKDFPSGWQLERRIEYLKAAIENLKAGARHEMTLHADYVRRNRLTEMILTQDRLDGVLVKIIKAEDEIAALRRADRPGKDTITPDMIERAKQYPFTDLYQFKRNMARCPFHEDHTPSFVLMKDNRARCFGACAKTWDTIQFLIDKEGLRFPEAVRQLQ